MVETPVKQSSKQSDRTLFTLLGWSEPQAKNRQKNLTEHCSRFWDGRKCGQQILNTFWSNIVHTSGVVENPVKNLERSPPLEDQQNLQKPEKQRKSIENQRKTKEIHTTTLEKREDWGPGGPRCPLSLSLFYSCCMYFLCFSLIFYWFPLFL